MGVGGRRLLKVCFTLLAPVRSRGRVPVLQCRGSSPSLPKLSQTEYSCEDQLLQSD
jgi:hypothetical protein